MDGRTKGSDDMTDAASEQCFDRVLVDAECTHDASLRHLEKPRAQQQRLVKRSSQPRSAEGHKAPLAEVSNAMGLGDSRRARPVVQAFVLLSGWRLPTLDKTEKQGFLARLLCLVTAENPNPERVEIPSWPEDQTWR